MAKLRNTCFYEFYSIDNLDVPKSAGYRTLSNIILKTGIDTIPTLSFTIPLEDLPTDELERAGSGEYYEPKMQRYIVAVSIQSEGIRKYYFRGIIDNMNIDYANYSVALSLSHEVARMREWSMPVNYTIKNMPLDFAISDKGAAMGYSNPIEGETMQTYDAKVNFDYYGFEWQEMPRVSMTFGANNKLEALSEIIQNTEYCHFWVNLRTQTPTIVIQDFSEPLSQQVISGELTFSPYQYQVEDCDDLDDKYQVTMLTEPTFEVDYTGHYNRAIVFCGDIQDGVNHLTLEPIYSRPDLWIPGFPVKMYSYQMNVQPEPEYKENGTKINNEKIYRDYEVLAYTKNTNREFYVEDSEQLAEDSNIILNTTFNFSDMYPIPRLQEDIDNDGTAEELVITDDDRLQIAYQTYLRAVRKLKIQRPQRVYQFNSTALPWGVCPGWVSRLAYAKSVNQDNEECEGQLTKRKVLNIFENMYLTEFTVTYDDNMNEVCTITLDNEVRPHDISATEIELQEKAVATKTPSMVADFASSYSPQRIRNQLARDEMGNFLNMEHTLAEAGLGG